MDAKNFLKLEFDCCLDFIDSILQWFFVGNDAWEHTNFIECWSHNLWKFLCNGISGKKEIVFLCPLLDDFLVFVEFGDCINVDCVKTECLCLFDVVNVSNNADFIGILANAWKSESSRKSLVLLGIVVLEANLKFDGLSESSLL